MVTNGDGVVIGGYLWSRVVLSGYGLGAVMGW